MSEAKLYKPDLSIRLIFSLGIIAVLVLWIVLLFFLFGGSQLAVFLGLFGAYFAPGFGLIKQVESMETNENLLEISSSLEEILYK